MNIGEVSFFAGTLLFFVGIIGGGIDIKEVKIPQITGVSRYACFIGSALFITLGLYLKNVLPPTITTSTPSNATASNAPSNAGSSTQSSAGSNSPKTKVTDAQAAVPTTPPIPTQQPVLQNQPQPVVASNTPINAAPLDNPPTPGNSQARKESAGLALYQAKEQLDEANKQINIVWNATSKEIREILLPEQRIWLKQRENGCSLQASNEESSDMILQEALKFRCMAAMTGPRTEELAEEIKNLTQN